MVPGVSDLLLRCTFPAPGSELHCGVSGGADSSALLVLASLAGCRVIAHHVDHGLRPGSDVESEIVAKTAQRFRARFVQHKVELVAGPNLEARARSARFSVLPHNVATGHTMDDRAETVLVNILRGAGLDGLGVLREGDTHPIVALRREETRWLCHQYGLELVHDPTNDELGPLRNRIRHELLPQLRALSGRDPVPILARLSEQAGADITLLEQLSEAFVPDPSDLRSLRGAPAPLRSRAIRRWLREMGVTERTGGRRGEPKMQYHPPSAAVIERVRSVVNNEATATQIGGGWRVRRRFGHLQLEREPSGNVAKMATPTSSRKNLSWAGPTLGPEVISEAAIAAKVAELGAQITMDYSDDPPLLVGVLKGAMIFMSDICRAISLPVDVDFMAVSSYGSATTTSGVVRIVKDLDAEITDRRVLVVEDIIDSGLTLNYLRRYLQARKPKSVDVCALLVKEGEQRVEQELKYVGFRIPPTFVVGYGLDVAERFRNLPGIYTYLDGHGG